MITALLTLLIVLIVVIGLAYIATLLVKQIPVGVIQQIGPIIIWIVAVIICLLEIVRLLPRLGI